MGLLALAVHRPAGGRRAAAPRPLGAAQLLDGRVGHARLAAVPHHYRTRPGRSRMQSGWRMRLQRSRLSGGFYVHADPTVDAANATPPSLSRLSRTLSTPPMSHSAPLMTSSWPVSLA
eukprot:1179481-Prymnesium_polylepis.1